MAPQGEYDRAFADFTEAIRLDSTDVYSRAELAWLHIKCPNYLDVKRGIELATKACELSGWKDGYCLRMLAIACAEAGDFENAVKWQEKSLELSPESEKKKWGFLLDLYRSGKPFPIENQEFRLGDNGLNTKSTCGLIV